MEFDIEYIPQKAVKGQALADFLAAHAVPDDSPLAADLPDEEVLMVENPTPRWEMYFDGASRKSSEVENKEPEIKAGAGIVFLTPTDGVIYHSLSLLKEKCSNNEAEYEALISGLSMALKMNILSLYVFGDSQLVIRQMHGIYEVRKPELFPYYEKTKELMSRFAFINLEHVPRRRNARANALAQLAAALALPDSGRVEVVVEERLVLPPVLEITPSTAAVDMVDHGGLPEDDWRTPFLEFLKHGRLPEEKNKI